MLAPAAVATVRAAKEWSLPTEMMAPRPFRLNINDCFVDELRLYLCGRMS
jgi:hypothetical protein